MKAAERMRRPSKPEYWVMRIVVPGGAHVDAEAWKHPVFVAAKAEIARRLELGHYQVVGDDIVEPIECHDEQATALAQMHREFEKTKCPHKVTLNVDIEHD